MSDVFYCLFAATTPKLLFYLNCLEVVRECFTRFFFISLYDTQYAIIIVLEPQVSGQYPPGQ